MNSHEQQSGTFFDNQADNIDVWQDIFDNKTNVL